MEIYMLLKSFKFYFTCRNPDNLLNGNDFISLFTVYHKLCCENENERMIESIINSSFISIQIMCLGVISDSIASVEK